MKRVWKIECVHIYLHERSRMPGILYVDKDKVIELFARAVSSIVTGVKITIWNEHVEVCYPEDLRDTVKPIFDFIEYLYGALVYEIRKEVIVRPDLPPLRVVKKVLYKKRKSKKKQVKP